MLHMPRHALRRARIALVAAVAVLAGGCPGGSGSNVPPPPISLVKKAPTSLRAKVDLLVQPLIDEGWLIGAAIALIDDDEVTYLGYGQVAADDPRRPSPDTVFEIGSVSKVFTALLLADLATAGKLYTDTPLQELLPQGVSAPRFVAPADEEGAGDPGIGDPGADGLPGGDSGGGDSGDGEPSTEGPVIVLGHLASHTSGLPRLPANLAPEDLDNPYADYTEAQLYDALAAAQLASEPGESYQYSNFGAGLLGHVLARERETTYEALVIQRLTGPLGMSSTSIELSQRQLGRLALGHDGDGRMVSAWDFSVLAGAGGLRSTARDMAAFVKAHIDLEPQSLEPAIRLAEKELHPVSDEGGSVGLGWHIDDRGVRWHNGQTGGYYTYVAYHRSSGTGVVLLCNTATWMGDGVGRGLVDGLRGKWGRIEVPDTASVEPARLASYAGQYRLGGSTIAISLEGGQLVGRIPGRLPARLYPLSDTEMYLRISRARIAFAVENGRVAALVLRAQGREIRAERVAGP